MQNPVAIHSSSILCFTCFVCRREYLKSFYVVWHHIVIQIVQIIDCVTHISDDINTSDRSANIHNENQSTWILLISSFFYLLCSSPVLHLCLCVCILSFHMLTKQVNKTVSTHTHIYTINSNPKYQLTSVCKMCVISLYSFGKIHWHFVHSLFIVDKHTFYIK